MRDPEKHWRKYATPGTEDLFAQLRDHYQGRKTFADQVESQAAAAFTWEEYIDRQARIAARMTRARIGARVLAAAYRARVATLVSQMQIKQGGRRNFIGTHSLTHAQPTALGDWIGD